MAWQKTGIKAHDDACLAAEGIRQVAVAASSTQAAIRTAEIAFYRSVRASCIANNGYSGIEAACDALRELGTGGV
jgi:hypothetical protein